MSTTTALFHLYGLFLESEIDLPEARRAPEGAAPGASVRFGAVDPDGLPDGRQVGPFLWAAPGALWLRVPEVARFLVTDGNQIVVDPHPGVDEDTVRLFLLGSGIGALLHQRGLLVLHGNAIRIGDGCLVCVGPSGSGKSTMAAELMLRGYPVLADDVVPVDDQGRAVPGLPRIKLWQDAVERLGGHNGDLRPIRPDIPKFDLPLDAAQFGAEPVPVRWIYVLRPRGQREVRFEPLRGMDRLLPLRANTYRFRFLDGMDLRPGHLASCGLLAGRAHVSVLSRPDAGVGPEEIADRLLADLGAHS